MKYAVQNSRLVMVLSLVFVLVLGACGNSNAVNDNRSIVRDLTREVFSRGADQAPPQVTSAQVAAVRAQTNTPILVVSLENNGSSAIFVEIERNESVITYGSANRRSISLDNGIVRGTRGFGGDLMSTTYSALRQTLETGEANGGTRIVRALNGAGETEVLKISCSYSSSPNIVEKCVGENGRIFIENSYVQSTNGTVVQSRQWISETLGYLRFQLVP